MNLKPTIYLPSGLAKLLIPVLPASAIETAAPLPCFCRRAGRSPADGSRNPASQ